MSWALEERLPSGACMRTFVWAVVIALSFAVGARAEDSAAQQKAAVELAKLALPTDQWKSMMDKMVISVTDALKARAPDLPADFGERLHAEMDHMLPYQEMIDLQSGLLVKYYTLDELQQLTAFYKTPLGQKAIKIMPDVMQDVMGHMQLKIQRDLPAVMERLMPKNDADPKDAVAPKKAIKKTH